MPHRNRKTAGVLAVTLPALLLAACGPPEETIQQHWENAAEAESDFADQDDTMTQLANDEQRVFDELTSYESEQTDAIEASIEEATSSVQERRAAMEEAQETLQQAYEEAMNAEEPIQDLEHEDMRAEAEQAQQALEQRHEAFQQVHEAYMEAIDEETEMYESFQNDDLALASLEQQLQTITTTYEDVQRYQETFNDETQAFNEAKNAFGALFEENQ